VSCSTSLLLAHNRGGKLYGATPNSNAQESGLMAQAKFMIC
jgi:hypothetical protein